MALEDIAPMCVFLSGVVSGYCLALIWRNERKPKTKLDDPTYTNSSVKVVGRASHPAGKKKS